MPNMTMETSGSHGHYFVTKRQAGHDERNYFQIVEVTSLEDMAVSGCWHKGCQGKYSDSQHISGWRRRHMKYNENDDWSARDSMMEKSGWTVNKSKTKIWIKRSDIARQQQ